MQHSGIAEHCRQREDLKSSQREKADGPLRDVN